MVKDQDLRTISDLSGTNPVYVVNPSIDNIDDFSLECRATLEDEIVDLIELNIKDCQHVRKQQ